MSDLLLGDLISLIITQTKTIASSTVIFEGSAFKTEHYSLSVQEMGIYGSTSSQLLNDFDSLRDLSDILNPIFANLCLKYPNFSYHTVQDLDSTICSMINNLLQGRWNMDYSDQDILDALQHCQIFVDLVEKEVKEQVEYKEPNEQVKSHEMTLESWMDLYFINLRTMLSSGIKWYQQLSSQCMNRNLCFKLKKKYYKMKKDCHQKTAKKLLKETAKDTLDAFTFPDFNRCEEKRRKSFSLLFDFS